MSKHMKITLKIIVIGILLVAVYGIIAAHFEGRAHRELLKEQQEALRAFDEAAAAMVEAQQSVGAERDQFTEDR